MPPVWYNNRRYPWRHSSVGQSARFTSVRSQVRTPLSPPDLKTDKHRSFPLFIGILFSSILFLNDSYLNAVYCLPKNTRKVVAICYPRITVLADWSYTALNRIVMSSNELNPNSINTLLPTSFLITFYMRSRKIANAWNEKVLQK